MPLPASVDRSAGMVEMSRYHRDGEEPGKTGIDEGDTRKFRIFASASTS